MFGCAVYDPELTPLWSRFRAQLQRAVSESTWHIWLEALAPRELRDDTLVVEAPDSSHAWIERHFARLLSACAQAALAGSRARPAADRTDVAGRTGGAVALTLTVSARSRWRTRRRARARC